VSRTMAFDDEIRNSVERYRRGDLSRRQLLRSLVALTGSYTAAHLFLEASGVAESVISPREAEAANVDAEMVLYPSGDVGIQAYLARPRGGGKYPAVIVIHENRGLNEHIRDVARRLAAEGFAALAPDLLSRVGGTAKMRTQHEATEAIGLLPVFAIIDDLKAGFAYLEHHPEVEPARIASVGFCWGGWRSFTLATVEPKLHRAVVFYGTSPESGYESIRAPVLAHYARWDNRITGNALWTEEMMRNAGKRYQYYVYEETDHAFFNDTGPRHNPKASALAWQRTLKFLRS
jgi:carboxymethylenebutenolidase